MVLLLRDILDSPEATARVWRKNGYFEAITTYYDQVLVVGCPDVFDLRHEYEFPPFAAAKVRYCGYIAREPGRQTRSEMRGSSWGGERSGWCWSPPGAARTATRWWTPRCAAWRSAGGRSARACTSSAAPRWPPPARGGAGCRAALPGVSLQDFSDDMMSLQAAADVVLAMGGYNTVCELLSCGKRGVLVPRIKPGQEQCIRAERMAGMGLLAMVHPDQLTPATLMRAVRPNWRRWRWANSVPRLRACRAGAGHAAIFEIGLGHSAAAVAHEDDAAGSHRGPGAAVWRRAPSPAEPAAHD
jgi:predicted glycosyltransferase